MQLHALSVNNIVAYSAMLLFTFVAWMLAVSQFSISSFPADALYYVKTLPPVYWAGMAVVIFIIAKTCLKEDLKDRYKLAPMLMLMLYLHGTPTLTYENPSFMDVFAHSSGAIAVTNSGDLNVRRPIEAYTEEYPISFILLSELMTVTNIQTLFLLKFYSISTILLITILIYAIGRNLAPSYAALSPLALVSLLWVDIHWSPQAVALPLAFIFLFSLIQVTNRNASRSWSIVLLLALLTINLTNPTTSYLMLGFLAGVVVIPKLLQTFYSRYSIRPLDMQHRLVLFILGASAMAGILAYRTNVLTLRSVRNVSRIESAGSLQGSGLPLNPDPSYLVANVSEIGIALFVALSGFFILWSMGRRLSDLKGLDYGLLIAWFVVPFVFAPVATYSAPGTTFLQRTYLFPLIIWAVFFSVFASWRSVKVRNILVAGILISAVLIPVTKYGPNAQTYIPYSDLYSSDTLLTHLEGGKLAFVTPGIHAVKYYYAEDELSSQIKLVDKKHEVRKFGLPGGELDDLDRYNIIIAHNYGKNSLALRLNLDTSSITNTLMNSDPTFNLVINSGGSLVYKTPTKVLVTEPGQ